MINKNFYRKTNDKKILHKVGKQWKVVSVALLMAIGGAAVATHAANAAETNDTDNASVNTLVNTLNSTSLANAPRTTYHASANSTSSASSSANSIEYYPGSNGSAARYFDKVDNDNATVNKYKPTVNAYVQSLNAEFNPQVRSFATTSNSARNAASNDSKLANSYSAVANKNTTMATVNSLAAANHMDPTLYQGMVWDNEQAYSDAVSSASDDVKANSDVASLVNSLEGFNFSSASMSASASAVVASSNYVGAEANYNSLDAKWGHLTNGQNLTTAASELSYGAIELYADGNNVNYNANVASLGQLKGVNGASLTSQFNSDVSAAYSSASDVFATASKNNELSDYAAGTGNYTNDGYTVYNHNLVTGKTAPALNSVTTDANARTSANENYNAAVSAATDIRFAPVLASAANSVFASYGIQYGTYTAHSKEASAIMASASAEVRSASYALDFANANSDVITSLSSNVQKFGGASSAAQTYLDEGINTFASSLGLIVPNDKVNENDFANSYVNDIISNAQIAENNNLNNQLTTTAQQDSSNRKNQLNQVIAAGVKALNDENISDIKSNLSNVPSWMNDLKNAMANTKRSANGTKVNTWYDAGHGNNATEIAFQKAVVNAFYNYYGNSDAFDNIPPMAADGHTKFHGYYMDHIVTAISDAMDKANSNLTKNIANATNDLNNQLAGKRDTAFNRTAALLSAGVDIDALERESGAIANVANAAKNAGNNNLDANKLNDDLVVAASSANSALGSAQSASAEYSAANDEDVTLANSFATSYASEANVKSDIASSASSELDSFFRSTASDSTFDNADGIYNSAAAAATNDYKLGVANAQSIYNSNAHFLDVLKGARLHSTPHYGSKKFDDKIVGSVKKGDRLTVHGVNVSRNGDIRGVIRYYVTDNTTGAKGFFTGQPNYSKPAYLNATGADADVNIKTLKPVNVYSEINGKKAIATVPAGKVLENATVVYDNDAHDAYGFTKVQAANGDFLTANTDYVEILNPTVNTNNNAPQSNFSNFNLQGGQHMADYYNNLSQD